MLAKPGEKVMTLPRNTNDGLDYLLITNTQCAYFLCFNLWSSGELNWVGDRFSKCQNFCVDQIFVGFDNQNC